MQTANTLVEQMIEERQPAFIPVGLNFQALMHISRDVEALLLASADSVPCGRILAFGILLDGRVWRLMGNGPASSIVEVMR